MTPNALAILFPSLIACGWVVSTQAIRSWTEGDTAVIDVGDTGPTSTFQPAHENSYDHYRRMFEEGRYSLLLRDGSLVAMTYKLKAGKVIWHRYCYVPGVIDLDIEAGETPDLLPPAAAYIFTPRKSLLRFEYDPGNQDVRHPYSHLHFNAPACRVPVSGALSVTDFLYAVVDLFYPDYLENLADALQPTQPSVSHMAEEDKKRLFIKLPL